MRSRSSPSSPKESCNRLNKSKTNQVVKPAKRAGAAKMSGRRNLGNVWKKAFMNTKTVEEQTTTDEELELIQNIDPSSDSMDAATTGSDSRQESSAPGVTPSGI